MGPSRRAETLGLRREQGRDGYREVVGEILGSLSTSRLARRRWSAAGPLSTAVSFLAGPMVRILPPATNLQTFFGPSDLIATSASQYRDQAALRKAHENGIGVHGCLLDTNRTAPRRAPTKNWKSGWPPGSISSGNGVPSPTTRICLATSLSRSHKAPWGVARPLTWSRRLLDGLRPDRVAPIGSSSSQTSVGIGRRCYVIAIFLADAPNLFQPPQWSQVVARIEPQ